MKIMTLALSALTLFAIDAVAAARRTQPNYKAGCAVYRVDDNPAFLTHVSVDLKPGESKEILQFEGTTLKVSWEKNSYLSLAAVNNATGLQRMAGMAIRKFPAQFDFVPGTDIPVSVACLYPDPAATSAATRK